MVCESCKIKHVTTEEQFVMFCDYASKFISFFGLIDWRIDYEHDILEDNCRASYTFNTQGKVGCIALNKNWSAEPTQERIRQTAFHEVMELMLADVWSVAMDPDISPAQRRSEMEWMQHAVIRRMENTILPLIAHI